MVINYMHPSQQIELKVGKLKNFNVKFLGNLFLISQVSRTLFILTNFILNCNKCREFVGKV